MLHSIDPFPVSSTGIPLPVDATAFRLPITLRRQERCGEVRADRRQESEVCNA